MTSPLELGLSKLKAEQLDVYNECLERKNGGLCLSLGAGKTLTSLVIALKLSGNGKILVVCSKTLVSSWENEIKKFFGNSLKYLVFHASNKKINLETYNLDPSETGPKVIITTPETLSKFYKSENIGNVFIDFVQNGIGDNYNRYNRPREPFGNQGMIYSTVWGCSIVDEAQTYTNIESIRCKAICALCANHKWVTSATLFDEPKIERIFGYYMMINHPKFPRDLPSAATLIRSRNFKGTKETIVVRTENKHFVPPKVNEFIVNNSLTQHEEQVYVSMKAILNKFNKKLKEYRSQNNVTMARKFSSYLMALITYLKQCVVAPLLPIATVFTDFLDLQNKSHLTDIMVEELNSRDLKGYFSDPKSVYSSRIKKVIETLNSRSDENVVVFMNFRSCLDIIRYYIPKDRNVLTIASSDSIAKRQETVKRFGTREGKQKGDVFLLTYQIGCEGLNLQSGSTVLLVDFYWNNGKTNQAIGRCLRYGQQAKEINIYYFTSGTGIEKAVFTKQNQKLTVLEELHNGRIISKVDKIKVNDIIDMINVSENNDIMKKLDKLTIN